MTLGGPAGAHLTEVTPLSIGGRDDLFAATHGRWGRVSIRHFDRLDRATDREWFLDEAGALAELSDGPGIHRVLDAEIGDDGRPMLIMEPIDGSDLARHLADFGPLDWTDAVDVALALGDGLAQVHGFGWLHRELRPANVLVDRPLHPGRARLGDVGLLPGWVPDGAAPDILVHRAPEAIPAEGDRLELAGADHRSDLYSLTSMLHELIDGRPAHWRPSDTADTLAARIAGQAAPILDPDMVPEALQVFITAGLSKDPLDRPQDAEEFTRELALIRFGRTGGPLPPWPPPTPEDRSPALPTAGGTAGPDPAGESGPGATGRTVSGSG